MPTASGLEQLFQQLGDQHYGKGVPWQSPFWQLGQSWHQSCYCGSLLSKVSSCRVNLPATRAAGFQTSLQGSDLILLCSERVLVARWRQTIVFGINVCWTKPSAGPAPPGRAMTHVLVKTRCPAAATDSISEMYLPRINPEEWKGQTGGATGWHVRKGNLPYTGLAIDRRLW